MKLGIVGKGGVGKTTVSALLARSYAADGARVLAIDTDSNPNLGVSLGLSVADMENVPVLPRAVIVGSGGDRTPEELVRDYGRITPAGVSLLSAIKVSEAGAGCMCGGHATVRSLLGTALEEHADVAIVDMEAGLEHLSRSGGTLAHADVLLVVMEPTRKSVLTASRTAVLAEELGIPRTVAVGNKARDASDADFFRAACAEYGVPLAGVLPYDAAVVAADLAGGVVDAEQGVAVLREVAALRRFLDGVPVA
ncbi:nucleotide-binding protein [Pseudonocardia nigra]|uniref:nucleotide-binding protein n=1 Tax=Pseudonocardia nigra TaxID=1921578 RepID=UPI001C5E472E|nr:AAA family ATPase [Pseudonocardia nigra]